MMEVDDRRRGSPPARQQRFSILLKKSITAGNTVAGENHLGSIHTDYIRRAVREAVYNELDRKLIDQKHRPEVKASILSFIRRKVFEEADFLRLPGLVRASLEDLSAEILDEVTGYGPIQPLLEDDEVTEVMVNGPGSVYVERKGSIELTGIRFRDADSVLQIIERIIAPIGRKCDESTPYVDARLPDGSRVNAIIPPLSLTGPVLTIRKFFREPLDMEDLIRLNTLTVSLAGLLECCVRARLNIVISGGTGSGKTTTLNVLSSFIPEEERIITIEDAAELQLRQKHLITLESRPPNSEGRGTVSIRDLVRNALRMRPDRIIVGEVRGGEALDMLQAMNTGHDGSITTGHANSAGDMLARLETMVLMSGVDLPLEAVRDQIASAVHLVLHQKRFRDGRRRVSDLSVIKGRDSSGYAMERVAGYNPGTDSTEPGPGMEYLRGLLEERGFPYSGEWGIE
ncbi:MAG: CpaF family protein [Bacillota bacterium]